MNLLEGDFAAHQHVLHCRGVSGRHLFVGVERLDQHAYAASGQARLDEQLGVGEREQACSMPTPRVISASLSSTIPSSPWLRV